MVAPGWRSSIVCASSAVIRSPGTNSPGVVDEEAAVGVAVPGDAEIGALAAHPLDDEAAVLLEQRVGLVVGEVPVGLEVVRRCLHGEAIEHRPDHGAGHAVAAVEHDRERPHRRGVDERRHAVVEPGVDVALRDLAGLPGRRRLHAERALLDLVEARVRADREGAAADDLHAVVGGRVVRRGHLQAALVAVLADREVEHLGADLTQVDDVRAGLGRAADGGGRDLGRRQPHVPADRHHLRLERGDISRARGRRRRPRRARPGRCRARHRP